MNKLIELRERMTAALKELGELHGKEDRSADDETRIDALLAETNELGPKIVREQSIEDATRQASQYTAPAGRQIPGGGQAAAGAAEAQTRDRRSLGQRFAESDQVKNWSGGRSQPFDVGSFYHREPTAAHRDGMAPDEVRTLIGSAALPADYIQATMVPGWFRGTDLQGTLRDVLINGQTDSDAITFFRELVFTNAAAGVAQATATDGATGLKPESALTFEQVTAPVQTIAHWIPITRQALDDASQLRTYVEQRLLDGLRLEESAQLLNGAAAPDLVGILATPNVQALNAAYFLANPVTDAGTNNESFNRILRARRMVRTTGRAQATFAVVNPADMELFLSATDGNTQYLGTGPFQASPAVASLWGLRVVEDENIAANTVLVGDGRMAAIWDRMSAQVFIDTINDQFVRNMFTLLAEERLALTVFRPTAFAIVTLEPV
jgi:HK97 family phage major capsid protein